MADHTSETTAASNDTESKEQAGRWLVDNLGETLLAPNGKKIATEELLDKKVVSFYFSAHWCGPCRGFTPVLAKTYKAAIADGKEWDVIFLSSDRDKKSFESYYAEMPWKALPYDKRKIKDQFSKKFKVRGIPYLIMVHPRSGEILNKEGRSAIMAENPIGNFPWINKPKPIKEVLGGAKLIDADNKPISYSDLNVDYLAIYYSAHWCPPCRGFTPSLIEWYNNNKKDLSMELLFNSWDKDQEQFDSYFKDMPFVARSFADKSTKEELDKAFEVEGIPALVVIDNKTGQLVTKEGRTGVMKKPKGFPWEKMPVQQLGAGCIDALNGAACVMVITSPKMVEAIKEALTPSAMQYVKMAKAAGDWPGTMDVEFIIDDCSDDLHGRIDTLIKRTKDEIMFIMDLGSKKIFNCKSVKADTEITKEVVGKFMADYKAGSLDSRDLEL